MPPQKETVIKLTSARYKKPGVSEQAFHDYGTRVQAPKAAIIQARHGALKVSQYHTPTSFQHLFRTQLPWAVRGPGWSIDDHDIFISVYVRKVDDLVKIVMDPEFQALVAGEDDIVDGMRGTVSAGWEEVYVEDGKIVIVVEWESMYPGFEEAVEVVGRGWGEGEGGEVPKELAF
ncbi:hypothetical protein BDV96DRAFT_607380 [Lophiotrema nucula]|uniref:EthD domain-containing protein n=1 Tax=Lophiotrema nucula TaxID=690887 RepID=A0A6A5YGY1_9PLEO|nr:hypothetical protein BDV96DRAFT_607380 [Lophiotrema nucula]